MSDKQELHKAVDSLKEVKKKAGEKLNKAVDTVNQIRREQAGK